jgi:Rrf2 family protein
MRLRTQVRQALHCCVVMAVSTNGPLKTSFLAETCGLPREYLAKTLQALARAWVIFATYGPGGGYGLNREARDISVLDIVEAIEGPTDTLRSKVGAPHHGRGQVSNTLLVVGRLVGEADAAWQAVLKATSIQDVVDQVELETARATNGPETQIGETPVVESSR